MLLSFCPELQHSPSKKQKVAATSDSMAEDFTDVTEKKKLKHSEGDFIESQDVKKKKKKSQSDETLLQMEEASVKSKKSKDKAQRTVIVEQEQSSKQSKKKSQGSDNTEGGSNSNLEDTKDSKKVHNTHGTYAPKDPKSGVVAIKEVRKKKAKVQGTDLFAAFQTEIGSGSGCAWWYADGYFFF